MANKSNLPLWTYEIDENPNHSSLSVARVIKTGSRSDSHGPLVIANLNVCAFAPHMAHVHRHGNLIAGAPELLAALKELLANRIAAERMISTLEFQLSGRRECESDEDVVFSPEMIRARDAIAAADCEYGPDIDGVS